MAKQMDRETAQKKVAEAYDRIIKDLNDLNDHARKTTAEIEAERKS